MIRVIQRKIIIPRGDTGSFSISNIVEGADIGVFSLINPLTRQIILEKSSEIIDGILTFNFKHDDTVLLEPRKYWYDITLYTNPTYDEDGKIIDGESINSYYGAYSLPVCEIRK